MIVSSIAAGNILLLFERMNRPISIREIKLRLDESSEEIDSALNILEQENLIQIEKINGVLISSLSRERIDVDYLFPRYSKM